MEIRDSDQAAFSSYHHSEQVLLTVGSESSLPA